MISFRDTLLPLVPLALTFLLAWGYHSVLAGVLSGVSLFAGIVTLATITWYLFCRLVYHTDTTAGGAGAPSRP